MHHPGPALYFKTETCALYGTFVVNLFFIISKAWFGSKFGGSLIESRTEVYGLNTLPAIEIEGIPSIPVIARFGLQTLFKYIP